MVSSLDGFIAKKDGNISWMKSKDHYDRGKALTDAYIVNFLQSIDCYIMGSKTYERALELGWPYGEKPVFVMSSRSLTSDRDNVTFHSGNIGELVNKHLKPKYKSIWMVGGALLTKEFLRLDLVDEIVCTIMPIVLGDGTLFFDYIGKEIPLHLLDVVTYNDGMVELTYEIGQNKVS